MANSSSLVLLPARQAAQMPRGTHNAPKPSAKVSVSFGPKLEIAKKLKTVTAPAALPAAKPAAAKPLVSKPVISKPPVTKPADEEPEKNPAETPEHSPKKNIPDDETADAGPQAAVKTATPAAVLAQAQAVVPVEQKAVKAQKSITAKQPSKAGSSAKPQPAAHPVQQVAEPSKQKTTLENIAGAAGTQPDSTDASKSTDAPDDAIDSADNTVNFGGGFYGSAKIVARGSADAGDDTQAAGAADADTAAEAAASSGAGTDVPAATAEAQIATDAASAKPASASDARADTATVLNALTIPSTAPSAISGKAAVAASPQAAFVAENHPTIVSGIQGQLLPKGGTMQIRLDPPELGALQVTVHLKDGVMSASFQTSNEDATKLLTRSLGQLKTGLEAAGVSVEKLHVEQAPKQDAGQDSQKDSDGSAKQPPQDQQRQAQQDQQRRELVQRMWRKLAGGGDPLDLVA